MPSPFAPAAHGQKSPVAQAAHARAQQHLAVGRFKEAAAEMETAVRYEPRFALGWYVLASAQRRAARCDEAIFAYRRYMELKPGEPDPHYGAGVCLQSVGDREGATTALRRYVELDQRPGSREFVENARKRLAELERATVAAAKRQQTPASPMLVEARQHRAQGRTEGAIAKYRAEVASAAKAPSGTGSADAHAELGALLVSARRPQEAVELLREAVRREPGPHGAQAWYHLAFALRESGHPEEAVDAYRRYITFRPTDPDPYYGLGRALAKLGRDQQALIAFRTYALLETRLTERQWLKKARTEIARLESQLTAGATATSPPSSRVGAARSLPAVAPPSAHEAPPPSAPPIHAPPARQP